MKTKLIIIIIFCSVMSSFGQSLRPPIETNDLRTLDKFKWQGLEMQRDSLSYWAPINQNSFTLYRPDASFSQTYSFPNDSVYWAEQNIWVCTGCNIYYNDSIFYVRRNLRCSDCWQYSYDRVEWRDLFCEPDLERDFEIIPSSRKILKEEYYSEWAGEDSMTADRIYLGFKRLPAYEGKTLRYVNDTVRWLMPEIDSFYVNNTWLLPYDSIYIHDTIWFLGNPYSEGDTLPFIDQKDFWYYKNDGIWVGNDDTLQIIFPDDSPTNELDSFNFNGDWIKNGDFIFIPDPPAPPPVYYNINGKNYYNGSSLIVDTSFTNELDSLFYDKWLKNGDTLKITFPVDSLRINGIWYSNGDSVTIAGGEDTCLWKKLGSGIIAKMDNIGVGDTAWRNVAITGKNRVAGGAGVRGTSTAESAHGVLGYATESDGNGVWGISHLKYGIRGDSYYSYSGYFNGPLGLLTNKLVIGTDVSVKYTLPAVDGDSLEFLRTDGNGNVYWDAPVASILDSAPIFSGDSTMIIMTLGDGSVKWDALPEDSLYFENLGNWAKAKDTVDLFWLPSDSVGRIYYGTQGEWLKNEYGKINVYSDDEPAGNFASTNSSGLWAYSKNLTAFSAHADNGIAISASGGINGGGIFTETSHNPALKSYSYDSTAVDAHSTYGYAVMARSDFGYSGHFYGGKGVKIENNLYVTDSLTTDDAIVNKTLRVKDVATFQDSISAWGNLKVFGKTTSGTLQMGTGSTISRSGTMMSYDLWFGTQAEWNANTPKNGIYPQASTTFWTIKD